MGSAGNTGGSGRPDCWAVPILMRLGARCCKGCRRISSARTEANEALLCDAMRLGAAAGRASRLGAARRDVPAMLAAIEGQRWFNLVGLCLARRHDVITVDAGDIARALLRVDRTGRRLFRRAGSRAVCLDSSGTWSGALVRDLLRLVAFCQRGIGIGASPPSCGAVPTPCVHKLKRTSEAGRRAVVA